MGVKTGTILYLWVVSNWHVYLIIAKQFSILYVLPMRTTLRGLSSSAKIDAELSKVVWEWESTATLYLEKARDRQLWIVRVT